MDFLNTLKNAIDKYHVERAGIVLAASEGQTNKAIAKARSLCEETVGIWRKRWLEGSADLGKLEHQPKRLREAIGAVPRTEGIRGHHA